MEARAASPVDNIVKRIHEHQNLRGRSRTSRLTGTVRNWKPVSASI